MNFYGNETFCLVIIILKSSHNLCFVIVYVIFGFSFPMIDIFGSGDNKRFVIFKVYKGFE